MALAGRTAYVAVGVVAVGAVLATALPLLANDDDSVTVTATADTTATQVVQDGDNGVKTTLATCPQLCDRNPSGWRDAVVQFTVAGLPANATRVRARLRLHAWTATAARVEVFPEAVTGAAGSGLLDSRPPLADALGARDAVAEGNNDWDVSPAVTGNGTYAFTLRQATHNTRVYWASRENRKKELRPELTVTYDTGSGPAATPPPSAALPGTPVATLPAGASPSSPAKPTAGASASSSAPADSAVPPGWKLSWSDEFNGTALDPKRWNAKDATSVDYDLACITKRDQNVFVRGGLLTLRARKESLSCGSQHRAYTTSYLDTIGRASFTYGRFEVRAKSPTGPNDSKGLWPAFWLRPDDGGNGEIDVVELPGGAQYYRAATQAIFHDYKPTKQDNRYTFETGNPADGFHTYTTEWEPGVLRWYIDGKRVYQRDRSTTPWFDEVFKRPYHLRLNFQVGGWLGDPDASTAFPADFQVDYVRVWQR
jgi:beta-glucanase (GH16 family)